MRSGREVFSSALLAHRASGGWAYLVSVARFAVDGFVPLGCEPLQPDLEGATDWVVDSCGGASVLARVFSLGSEHYRLVEDGAGGGSSVEENEVRGVASSDVDGGAGSEVDGGTSAEDGLSKWFSDYVNAICVRPSEGRVRHSDCC